MAFSGLKCIRRKPLYQGQLRLEITEVSRTVFPGNGIEND
jgi:hypothetical protein